MLDHENLGEPPHPPSWGLPVYLRAWVLVALAHGHHLGRRYPGALHQRDRGLSGGCHGLFQNPAQMEVRSLGTGGLGTWRALHRPLVGILVPPDFPDIHLLAHFLGGANVVKIQLSG